MTQLDIVKAFLEDADIQQKYGLTPEAVAEMTMTSTYSPDTQVLVSLIRQMVTVVEDQSKTTVIIGSILNQTLETALH